MSGTHKYSISGAAAAVIIFKESWPTLSLTPFYICYKSLKGKKKAFYAFNFFSVS